MTFSICIGVLLRILKEIRKICDAYPGRLNQSSVYLNREGTYFGQCSEICGILHSSMPIAIQSVIFFFLYWIYDQIEG